MKNYTFIVTASDDRNLLIGYCKDISKTIKFFKELPNLHTPMEDYNRLVYVEEHPNEQSAIDRFNELTGYTRELKEFVIDAVNPEWIELKPGVNFELI